MNDAPRATVAVGAIHYQILCAGGLALVLLGQLDQGPSQMLGSVLVVLVGLAGMAAKLRVAPLLTLFFFAAAQVGNRFMMAGTFTFEETRPWLHPRDLLIGMGLVGYLAAAYRLQSLWLSIVPLESRSRPPSRPMERQRQFAAAPEGQPRGTGLLSPQEIARFVVTLPLWALLGQTLWLAILQPWTPQVLPLRLHRLITLTWLLVIGGMAVGAVVVQWRRRQMDDSAARLCLQDVLWRETRREQRRIFRWLAWRRLHERARDGAKR